MINKRLISPGKIILGIILFPVILYNILLINVPNFTLLKTDNPKFSSYMREDPNLNKTQDKKGIDFVSLAKISPQLLKAVLVAEDDLFFSHSGFNFKEITKSFRDNLKRKRLSRGASTITQQLARNLYLTKDKNFLRKLREVLITVRLEQTLSKERILELYLNVAEFAPSVYGVKAATAYHFLDTLPSQLSSRQAALLAAMLPNPKLYGKNPERYTSRRQTYILRRMLNYDLEIPKTMLASTLPPTPNKKNEFKTTAAKITLKKKEDVVDDTEEFDEDLDPEQVFLDE